MGRVRVSSTRPCKKKRLEKTTNTKSPKEHNEKTPNHCAPTTPPPQLLTQEETPTNTNLSPSEASPEQTHFQRHGEAEENVEVLQETNHPDEPSINLPEAAYIN